MVMQLALCRLHFFSWISRWVFWLMKIEQPIRAQWWPICGCFNLTTKTKGGITHMMRCRHRNWESTRGKDWEACNVFQPRCLVPMSHHGKLLSCTESVTVCLCPLIKDLYLQSGLLKLKHIGEGGKCMHRSSMPHRLYTRYNCCTFFIYILNSRTCRAGGGMAIFQSLQK